MTAKFTNQSSPKVRCKNKIPTNHIKGHWLPSTKSHTSLQLTFQKKTPASHAMNRPLSLFNAVCLLAVGFGDNLESYCMPSSVTTSQFPNMEIKFNQFKQWRAICLTFYWLFISFHIHLEINVSFLLHNFYPIFSPYQHGKAINIFPSALIILSYPKASLVATTENISKFLQLSVTPWKRADLLFYFFCQRRLPIMSRINKHWETCNFHSLFQTDNSS